MGHVASICPKRKEKAASTPHRKDFSLVKPVRMIPSKPQSPPQTSSSQSTYNSDTQGKTGLGNQYKPKI